MFALLLGHLNFWNFSILLSIYRVLQENFCRIQKSPEVLSGPIRRLHPKKAILQGFLPFKKTSGNFFAKKPSWCRRQLEVSALSLKKFWLHGNDFCLKNYCVQKLLKKLLKNIWDYKNSSKFRVRILTNRVSKDPVNKAWFREFPRAQVLSKTTCVKRFTLILSNGICWFLSHMWGIEKFS